MYVRSTPSGLNSSSRGIIELLLESPLNIWGGTLAWSLPRASCAAPVSISRMTRPQKENEFFRQWKRRPSVHPSGPVSSLASREGIARVEIFLAPTFRTLSPARFHFSTLSRCARGVPARGGGGREGRGPEAPLRARARAIGGARAVCHLSHPAALPAPIGVTARADARACARAT